MHSSILMIYVSFLCSVLRPTVRRVSLESSVPSGRGSREGIIIVGFERVLVTGTFGWNWNTIRGRYACNVSSALQCAVIGFPKQIDHQWVRVEGNKTTKKQGIARMLHQNGKFKVCTDCLY